MVLCGAINSGRNDKRGVFAERRSASEALGADSTRSSRQGSWPFCRLCRLFQHQAPRRDLSAYRNIAITWRGTRYSHPQPTRELTATAPWPTGVPHGCVPDPCALPAVPTPERSTFDWVLQDHMSCVDSRTRRHRHAGCWPGAFTGGCCRRPARRLTAAAPASACLELVLQ